MGKSSLILAALAKAALPGVDFNRAVEVSGDAHLKVAVLFATDGRTVVAKRPTRQASRNELESQVRGLQALGATGRARLPFAVESLLNRLDVSANDSVWFFDQLEGSETYLDKVSPSGTLAESIGEALGAIHNLPLSVVTDAFLPELNPADIALKYVTEMDKMAETGKIPANLLDRWQTALEDVSLFRYQPTVVHGSIDSETVLSGVVDHAEVVTGITNWAEMHIGDPAEDFGWVFGSALPELADAILLSYNTRHPNSDTTLRQRGHLYSELQAGRWLLHGLALQDPEIIADAEEIIADLAQALENDELPPLTKVLAPIAPVVPLIDLLDADATDATADEYSQNSSNFVFEAESSGEMQADSADETDSTDKTANEAVSSETEPIAVVDEEVRADEDADPFGASNDAASADEEQIKADEPVDDKTRPIELPTKSDNELF